MEEVGRRRRRARREGRGRRRALVLVVAARAARRGREGMGVLWCAFCDWREGVGVSERREYMPRMVVGRV